MKKFNIIAAAVAATLMAASLSIPMAASLPTSAREYQITISTTAEDDTTVTNNAYTAYRIFDVSLYDADKSAYTYIIPTVDPLLSLEEIIAAAETAGATASSITTMDGLSAWLTDSTRTEAEIRAFADALWATLSTKAITPGTTANTYTSDSSNVIDTETAGYFLVAGSSNLATGETIASLVALTTTDPTQTINPKLTAPTLDKQVEEDGTYGDYASSQIGDTVNYKITTTMPDPAYVQQFGTNGDEYSYVIHDTMSEGLTFNDNIVITIGSTTISDSYYILTLDPNTSDDCTFEIDFDMAAIIENYPTVSVSGADIVVTYTCTLNDKAAVASTTDSDASNVNGAKLEYSNNPYDTTTTTTPEEQVYDWSFYETITKVNGDGDYLAGAEFEIYDGDNNLLYFLKADDGSETYTVVPADTTDAVSKIKSTDAGGFTIKGLDESVVYTVKEVTVPSGYTGSADKTFTLTATYNVSYTELTDLEDDDVTDGKNNLNIVNTSGSRFPFTGGMGTTLFLIGGGCLVAVAGVFLIAKK
ncbi:MAG: isopeptide-forming domain-containing fimbrial protein [Ruminococcus sp.]|nr:isopeptide-forming domain-containing fimbrial protein [Ruminococcus sp.]